MKHLISISQTILDDLHSQIAELTEQLEKERAYSRMLEMAIDTRVHEEAQSKFSEAIEDTGMGEVMKMLQNYRGEGFGILEVKV